MAKTSPTPITISGLSFTGEAIKSLDFSNGQTATPKKKATQGNTSYTVDQAYGA
jgi:hypothetical protein